ncbi:MAG: endospore germination permease [Peptococcaceae bacterium]|nr:endospore germination permease [Peptococcaceae bacterium]
MPRQPRVTHWQYFTLISGVLIANGIMSMPRAVAADAGRSAWLVILLVGCIVAVLTWLAHLVASHFPTRDAAEWPKTLLGPILGRIWMMAYLLRAIIFLLLTAQLYAGYLSVRLFPRTPTHVFALLVLALSLLAVLAKVRGFARFSEVAFYMSIPLILFIIIPFTKGNTLHLLPLVGDTPPSDLLKSALAASYSYAGFDFLWFVYPHLRRKASAGTVAFGAVLLTAIVYAFVTATTIMYFGLEKLGLIFLPTLAALRGIEMVLFERIDSLMMFAWLSTVVVTAAAQLYTATRLVQGLANGLSFPKVAAGLSGLFFIVAYSVTDLPLYQTIAISDIFGIFDLSFFVTSIFVFLILALVRNRKGDKCDEPAD